MNKNMDKIFCDVIFPIPLNQRYTYFLSNRNTSFNLIGSRVEVDFGREVGKIGVIVDVYDDLRFDKKELTFIKPIKSVIDPFPFFDKEQLMTAEWFSRIYLISFGLFLNQFFPISHKFVIKDAVILKNEENNKFKFLIEYKYLKTLEKINLKKISLFVPSSIQEKFEFYKELIFYSIEKDLQLLIIFPNTNYINDFYEFFYKKTNIDMKLNKNFAFYTGEVSLEERYKIWYLIRNKLINVVFATKIGVFLPFENISYIVVDECDSLGYRNPEVPMYNSLFILEKRIKNYSCRLVYSSFFHSVSYIYSYPLVSNKKCLEIGNNVKIITANKTLTEVISKDIYKFKQTLVIFPYRGSRGFYVCLVCKKFYSKKNFKVLTKSKKVFICSECGSPYYREIIFKDKKIIDFLRSKIKGAIIEEITSEMNNIKKLQKIEEFNRRSIDVLLSNLEILNYIYKIDFSNIGSLYFLSISEFLQKPNYLNYENFYRIIKTFASSLPQDRQIEFYIENISKEDAVYLFNGYENFYNNELKIREELKYPPFVHLVRIQVLSKDEKSILDFKDKILRNKNINKNIEVFIEREVEKNYKGYSITFILKLLKPNEKIIEKVMSEINEYNKKGNLLYIQHNPLI
ncbi:MAG: hypothetical protein RMJ67_00300 [Elusimicrobiota bacterium]|nr:hypothetical protein [Endomicrobiia bacterium]MDW8164941.1 hypothetical protein [Elusimicrobiota bacterium]